MSQNVTHSSHFETTKKSSWVDRAVRENEIVLLYGLHASRNDKSVSSQPFGA